jgi:hypothetical protein
MLFGFIPDEVLRVWAFFAFLACIAAWRLKRKLKEAVRQHDPDGQFRSAIMDAAKSRILERMKKK